MKKNVLTLLLVALAFAQGLLGRQAMAQTDAKNRSRLDIKPKSRAMPTAPHPGGFVFLRTTPTRELNPRREVSINQYYRALLLTSGKPAPKTIVSDVPLAAPAIPAAEAQRNGPDEAIAATDRLFSNERLTVSNFYPNPANESTTVDYLMDNSVRGAKIAVYNVLGTRVGDFDLDRSERRLSVSTSELPNGIYFYQLLLEGRSLATKKLLIRHQ